MTRCLTFCATLLTLTALVSAAPAAEDVKAPAGAEPGFRSLFDGKSLQGWDGDPKLWRVEDGVITGETTKENPAKHNTFLIWRGGKPADFELKAEFRASGNSGIQFRSWETPDWRVSGYQADLPGGLTGTIYGEGFRGGLAGRGQKVTFGKDGKKTVEKFADGSQVDKAMQGKDWNEYHIVAKGSKIALMVNGQLACELIDEDKTARQDGILAFQIHVGGPMKVQFRNIRLKEFQRENPVKGD